MNNIVGIKGGMTTRGVSDSYWVLLKPFSIGTHNIHFSGLSKDYTSTRVNKDLERKIPKVSELEPIHATAEQQEEMEDH